MMYIHLLISHDTVTYGLSTLPNHRRESLT